MATAKTRAKTKSKSKPARRAPARTGFGPLDGLRVLDAGTMIAGPLAATHMADFGADVIKIEQPGIGDPMRHWAPMKEQRSLWWKVIGRNKRLITLALNKREGQAIFRRLAATADIVIENYRPGTFEKWGLGYAALAKLNPKIVLLRMSGFGQTGPYAQRGGYGTIAECFSGVPSFTGFPDKPPTLPGFPLADSIAATFGAMAAMMALHERGRNRAGRGQEIDVSLYEPLFRLAEAQVIGYDQLGIVKQRQGNRLAEDSPRNTYATKDGRWIGISASSQKTFERLAATIGKPEMISDPRFASNEKRCHHADYLDGLVADWFRQHDGDQVMAIFDKADVVAGPVYDIRDIVKDPHYAARNNIVSVPDEDFGQVRMQGVAPRLLRTPGKVRFAGRGIGTHNAQVYKRELGLSAAEIKRLAAAKVI